MNEDKTTKTTPKINTTKATTNDTSIKTTQNGNTTTGDNSDIVTNITNNVTNIFKPAAKKATTRRGKGQHASPDDICDEKYEIMRRLVLELGKLHNNYASTWGFVRNELRKNNPGVSFKYSQAKLPEKYADEVIFFLKQKIAKKKRTTPKRGLEWRKQALARIHVAVNDGTITQAEYDDYMAAAFPGTDSAGVLNPNELNQFVNWVTSMKKKRGTGIASVVIGGGENITINQNNNTVTPISTAFKKPTMLPGDQALFAAWEDNLPTDEYFNKNTNLRNKYFVFLISRAVAAGGGVSQNEVIDEMYETAKIEKRFSLTHGSFRSAFMSMKSDMKKGTG